MKSSLPILGLLILGVVAWGIKANMPDILRYMRMRSM